MRILVLANNWVGWQVLRWLKEQGEQIVGLAVHPPEKQKYGDEILSCAQMPTERVLDGSQLHRAELLKMIREVRPDIGVSAFFGYILRSEFLAMFPQGVINLHPAYLPYNRGAYPNVWSIVDGTPAGVTLHYIDAGVDTGDLISQQRIEIEPVDTGATLYQKLENACVSLFKDTWPLIHSGQVLSAPQPSGEGTRHRARDIEQIDLIDLEGTYTGRELIDVIRSRTFPPHRGAYIVHEGRKVYLRLQLLDEDQLRKEA